jgi:group I intron endonuclease
MIKYKDIQSIAGIYFIINNIDNKLYIGSSINCKNRAYQHVCKLNKNKHTSPHLQNAWNKYGPKNFDFLIIACVLDINDLCKIEQDFINEFKSYIKSIGYNMSPTAGNTLGIKLSPETITKLSKATSGKNNPFYGKKHTDHTKRILSTKAIENNKKNGNSFLNKKHSITSKEKMRLARRRIKFSCDQTKEIFLSTGDAARKLNINVRDISNTIYGRQKSTRGYTFTILT